MNGMITTYGRKYCGQSKIHPDKVCDICRGIIKTNDIWKYACPFNQESDSFVIGTVNGANLHLLSTEEKRIAMCESGDDIRWY